MRIAHSALATLLVISAVPSVSFAQIVIPYSRNYPLDSPPLDHVVPVATVTRPGEAIGLADAQRGDGFVLGAARLDLKDPDHPMVVFAMTNATETPIPLSTVYVLEVRVSLRSADGAVAVPCRASGLLLRRSGHADEALQPGATVSVEMPIAPRCGPGLRETLGFLVYLQADGGPPTSRSADLEQNTLLRNAFEKLRSQAQH